MLDLVEVATTTKISKTTAMTTNISLTQVILPEYCYSFHLRSMKSLANMSNVMARFVPMGHWSRSSAFGRGKSCGCVIMRVQLKFEWSKGLSKILLPNKGHHPSKNNADKDTTTSTPVLQEQIRLKQIVSATHPPWKSIQSHDLSLEIEAPGLIQNVQWPPLIEGSLNRNFRQYGQLKSRVE